MAINTQKFLPGSKGTAKPLPQAKISSITLTSQDKKNVNTIRVKTIQIDKMLKGTLAADKKILDDKKREASKKRKDDIETKLEKKPDLKKKIKMPNVLPKTGFLDWIKNFIGNVLLGYFAVRLIKHLPALKGLLTGIVAAGEFIIDWGGKILNGLVSFVDGAYKLYDGMRGWTKDIFGESGLEKFDVFMKGLNTFLNAVLILGLAIARVAPRFLGKGGKGGRVGIRGNSGQAGRTIRGGTSSAAARRYTDKFGKRAAIEKFGQEAVQSLGGRYGRSGVTNFARNVAVKTLGRRGAATTIKTAAGILKPLVRNIPLIGGITEFILSWISGDPVGRAAFKGIGSGLGTWIGGLLGTLIPIPGVGTAIGMFLGGTGGSALGGAIYDMIFSNKKPSPNKVSGHKGGGKVKNNKPRKARRTLTSRRSTSRKVITPPNIQTVKIDPGKSISGTEEVPVSTGETEVKSKIFGLFPNPWANLPKEKQPSEPSALDFIKKYGDKFGEMSYFGPMASLAVKALVGQKPSNKEYNDAGKGLSYLVGAGTPMGFAGGGSVAQRREKEISDKISKQLKKTMDPIVNSVIGDIEKSLSLSNEWDSATGTGRVRIGGGPSGAGSTYSTSSSGEYGDILDLISSVEAKSYDTINGGHIDGLSTMTIAGARRAALDSGIGSGAMGRYQQMPQFVLERARSIGLDPNKDLFSPENQDKLAILLIDGGGYKSWKSGSMTTEKFAYNLAGTWRGLPEGPSNLTFQDQYASGNKAHTTWDNVMGVLGGSKTSGSVSSGEYNKGSGQSIQLGTNKDGSLGSKLAGELGNYLKTSLRQGPDFQAVTEHSQHGGVRGRHAKNSYHYSDRAIDIGAWDWEQPKILAAISNFNKLKGISPVELLHAGNEPSGHSDHVHVAYHKGGYVSKKELSIQVRLLLIGIVA